MAISLKRVRLEEKLLWTAYRNSPMLFRMVPTGSHSPKSGVRKAGNCGDQSSPLIMHYVGEKLGEIGEGMVRF